MSERGRFITVEGGEGAGKSTQLALLAEALRRTGIAVVATREPGGSPAAEAVRGVLLGGETGRWDALEEALLLGAARHSHVARLIEPALTQGSWVVCDRFADSTLAYQGYGRGLPLDTLAALQRLVLGELRPDLTLILDLPAEAGLARAAARSGDADRFERLDREFHRRLRDGFLEIAQAEPDRCAVIDAAAPVGSVHEAIVATVAQRLGLPLRARP